MNGYQVLLGEWRGRETAVLLEGGVIEDLLVAPEDDRPAIGAIYRAKVERPLKGQGGVILSLGGGQKGYFRQGRGLAPGDRMLVQVTGYAEPGKAVPVTPRLLFKSRYAIVTPDAPGVNISRRIRDEDLREKIAAIAHGIALDPGHGAILRSVAGEAGAEELADDLAAMAELAAQVCADAQGEPELLVEGPAPADLAWRDWPEPDEVLKDEADFAHFGVAEMIDALLDPQTALDGGGSVFVEPTRALVAVDVNTGADTSPAAGLKANIAAARALPRLLRLKGLSGQIVLDLAPMPKKDRTTWEQVLKAALREDPVETSFVGWTPLGHAELQRKRERLPLHEIRA
ncbi:ribonuclease E/G [Mangrovicoccus algicola]|uniref:Ribonuclease E/G n=1 Tax=Mangrovicoccus algicola TaxID=2771008 RepID=A0A8J7CT02_9RHOB|nr:ribonuclease E/G [Mangrovicoccus algicola]MBE3636704.1 ribonuclease E/G [Mangrovicoccus algicola]